LEPAEYSLNKGNQQNTAGMAFSTNMPAFSVKYYFFSMKFFACPACSGRKCLHCKGGIGHNAHKTRLFMARSPFFTFKAQLDLIGINPFVAVPEPVLQEIFRIAGKDKGPIPVKGTVNGQPYMQTLVRFKGAWRLYINTSMLQNATQRIGEKIEVTITGNDDPPALLKAPAGFEAALKKDKAARAVFENLPPYLQKEINRYLLQLKTAESLHRNIQRAINFLKGKERFIGRDRP